MDVLTDTPGVRTRQNAPNGRNTPKNEKPIMRRSLPGPRATRIIATSATERERDGGIDMYDYTALIERLRAPRPHEVYTEDLDEVANAIATLSVQLSNSEAARTDLAKRLAEQLKKFEQLTKELELARGERDVVHKAQIEMMEEMARVKKGLDMAVDCITKMAHSGRIWMCPYCQHAKLIDTAAAECEVAGTCRKPYTAFVWRRVEET